MTKTKNNSFLAIIHGIGGGLYRVRSTEDYNIRLKPLHENISHPEHNEGNLAYHTCQKLDGKHNRDWKIDKLKQVLFEKLNNPGIIPKVNPNIVKKGEG